MGLLSSCPLGSVCQKVGHNFWYSPNWTIQGTLRPNHVAPSLHEIQHRRYSENSLFQPFRSMLVPENDSLVPLEHGRRILRVHPPSGLATANSEPSWEVSKGLDQTYAPNWFWSIFCANSKSKFKGDTRFAGGFLAFAFSG